MTMQRDWIICDLDGTLTLDEEGVEYPDKRPNTGVISRLQEFHRNGYLVAIFTSRNMRTFNGRVGKINIQTVPAIIDWLQRHKVPFDELHVGKPWCGPNGFYVDDKAIRPSEFLSLSVSAIDSLVGNVRRIENA